MGEFRESGQASPFYIFVVAILLFFALAYFAVGQAGALRNGAQSAADAAALAAAKESRDTFELTEENLGDLLTGVLLSEEAGCAAAGSFAAQNQAALTGCEFLDDGRWGSRVAVRSNDSMTGTVLPSIEGEQAVSTATAVVTPRCTIASGEDRESPLPEALDCVDGELDLDPDDLPSMADLFDIKLAAE
nr:pilus assembly protein TadG-related protein [Streptomyces solincola]